MTKPQLTSFLMVTHCFLYDKEQEETSVATLATFTEHTFGSCSNGYQRRKGNERNQIGKEVKLSLFADDMTLCTEVQKAYLKGSERSIRSI